MPKSGVGKLWRCTVDFARLWRCTVDFGVGPNAKIGTLFFGRWRFWLLALTMPKSNRFGVDNAKP